MQTSFTLAQLADPDLSEAEKILRTCVHCGFCTATCPTYLLLGNELDSPRGRIYLIKDMLEHDRPAAAEEVKHIDRCLSCLSCMTTCPSGVNYMHLVDYARVHIEETYRRPWLDRLLRATLARVIPDPRLFYLAITAGWFGKPFAPLLERLGLGQLAAMAQLAPAKLVAPPRRSGGVFRAKGPQRGRVAMLAGCVQRVLAPRINEAAIRLLTRHGYEVVLAEGEGCCSSAPHHMGHEKEALACVRTNIDAYMAEIDGEGLDAIIATASGCGTTMKDYGFMLRTDKAYSEKAALVAGKVRDVSEFVFGIADLKATPRPALRVAYHAACSLQHGQKITREPKELLSKLGFVVKDVPEAHLCCGSAGVYNLLQPELANRLRERKITNIEKTEPDVIAAGNLGCMMQIAAGTSIPVVHPIELADWATGGSAPAAMERTGNA
ncbi:MAG: glycolate oxidase subunit GlcF [Rhodoplanes sp.]